MTTVYRDDKEPHSIAEAQDELARLSDEADAIDREIAADAIEDAASEKRWDTWDVAIKVVGGLVLLFGLLFSTAPNACVGP